MRDRVLAHPSTSLSVEAVCRLVLVRTPPSECLAFTFYWSLCRTLESALLHACFFLGGLSLSRSKAFNVPTFFFRC